MYLRLLFVLGINHLYTGIWKTICATYYPLNKFTRLALLPNYIISELYNLKYCSLNEKGRDKLQKNETAPAKLPYLRKKVGETRINYNLVRNSSNVILQKVDDLIQDYENLIENHNSNNTNRNATFDNATMLLDDMSQRYSDIDGKLTSYLSISKQIYNLLNKTFLS